MSSLAYQALLNLVSPALLMMGRKQDPGRWRERLGYYPQVCKEAGLVQQPIWLHAASFGEAKAAGALIEAVRQQGYQGSWVVTTNTRTGGDAIAPVLREGDRHLYAPVDLKRCVKRALEQIQPTLLIVMEVEVWPNLWAECQSRSVPIVLANARLSESSLRNYQKLLPGVWRSTLQRASRVLAQDQSIANRFQRLGVNPDRLQLTGNLKYSQPLPDDIQGQGQQLRVQLGKNRPVWLAASTHEGEEKIAIECHRQLLKRYPNLLLVIVPRHPQRFDRVAQCCADTGLKIQRRSHQPRQSVDADCHIYLADSLGELLGFYAASDLCWVAGSFSDVGGHNILEPAGCGCPMVVGPDMRNFEQIAKTFIASKALIQVDTPEQLTDQLALLFANSDLRQQQAAAARQRLQCYQHASIDQARAILSLFPDRLPGPASL